MLLKNTKFVNVHRWATSNSLRDIRPNMFYYSYFKVGFHHSTWIIADKNIPVKYVWLLYNCVNFHSINSSISSSVCIIKIFTRQFIYFFDNNKSFNNFTVYYGFRVILLVNFDELLKYVLFYYQCIFNNRLFDKSHEIVKKLIVHFRLIFFFPIFT